MSPWATVSTISTEQSWRKKFSTWPAPPRRSSKLSPRLNTPSAKVVATLSSATVITGILFNILLQQIRFLRQPSLLARNPYCHSERSRGIPLQKLQLISLDPSASLRCAQGDGDFDHLAN